MNAIALGDLSSSDTAIKTAVQATLGKSFGREGAGIVLVNDLPPSYFDQRSKLLRAGYDLPSLPEPELTALEFPSLYYQFGWSHSREIFNGRPDTFKGSFYANPLFDRPSGGDPVLLSSFPTYLHPNVWPSSQSLPHFESSFKHIGRLIFNIALQITSHCDSFLQSNLHQLLAKSKSTKGRLLHYFPPPEQTPSENDNNQPLWCGYHNDHGLITGLLPSRFFKPDGTICQVDDKTAGLHIANTETNETYRANIPQDCLAFQIGESAQILTGGALRATAHAVHSSPTVRQQHLSRITLAVFAQPDPWDVLRLPRAVGPDHALNTSSLVPALRDRFTNGDTFDQFSKNTFAKYY